MQIIGIKNHFAENLMIIDLNLMILTLITVVKVAEVAVVCVRKIEQGIKMMQNLCVLKKICNIVDVNAVTWR